MLARRRISSSRDAALGPLAKRGQKQQGRAAGSWETALGAATGQENPQQPEHTASSAEQPAPAHPFDLHPVPRLAALLGARGTDRAVPKAGDPSRACSDPSGTQHMVQAAQGHTSGFSSLLFPTVTAQGWNTETPPEQSCGDQGQRQRPGMSPAGIECEQQLPTQSSCPSSQGPGRIWPFPIPAFQQLEKPGWARKTKGSLSLSAKSALLNPNSAER